MENSTYFNLTMFVILNIGNYRYPAFVLCFMLYAFIISANLTIIVVISREKTLHEPMYIFIMCLSINSLYGSAGFIFRFLRDLVSDTHLISRSACFTQIYVIYTYASYELSILAIMAYDRYVAVCQPLHYHNKITSKVVSKLVALAWIYPVIAVATPVYLASRLPLCGNKISKVFCSNWPVVKLSCVTTVINNLVGMFMTISTVFLPLVFVLYTYARIFLVSRKRSAEFKGKVIQSCLPHITTFVNYSITVFCDIALSRTNLEELNPFLAVILSLEFVVIPPIVNPVVYGLKLPEIKVRILRMLSCSKPD
ncbi:olfactory receptor 142-like [Micropterus salmoides]|uniref:olfactory receptor 142-like n=1 Tax=Micropterus salmoides TaxID=27706 RepID=UPI0018EBF754|nr:olfactory receptor 142-like [Micropterus salmoides]XP_045910047.1 olfactory receptor 142-like [Micropterus dolomieu]